MSNVFDFDNEHSRKMSLKADDIYRSVYPIEKIETLTKGDNPHILDKEFSIDKVLTLKNGMILTLQEKMLRAENAHWDCFTLEYKNNYKNEPGEFYKLCTDLYATGYGDDDFLSFYLFKTIEVKNAIIKNELSGILKGNNTHSTATFYAYPFNQFKEEWFVYKKELNL